MYKNTIFTKNARFLYILCILKKSDIYTLQIVLTNIKNTPKNKTFSQNTCNIEIKAITLQRKVDLHTIFEILIDDTTKEPQEARR